MRAPVAPTGWPREMPDPLTLIRCSWSFSPRPNSLVQARTWAAKRLVQLDQVQVGEGEAGPVEGRAGGGDGGNAHGGGGDPGAGAGDQAGERGEAEAFGGPGAGDQAGGGRVVLAAGVAGRDGGLRIGLGHHRAEGGELLGGGVGAGVFVGGDGGLALAGAYGDGDGLRRVPALGGGGGRPPLRAQGQGVLVGAADPVLPAQVLRRLDHAAGDRVVAAARRDPGAGEGVVELEARGP